MTDDDKQGAEPDPWAGLDAEAEGKTAGDDAAFIFDMLGEESADEAQPDADSPIAADGIPSDEGAFEGGMPLAVFPPHDAEPEPADVDPGVEPTPAESVDRPEIISLNEASGFEPTAGASDRSFGLGDEDDDPFDDAQLARDLAFSEPDPERPDFGDAADPSVDDVSFNASSVPSGGLSPFADAGHSDAFPPESDALEDQVAAVPIAAATIAAAGSSAKQPGKKKGGIGQLVGVVLGGVMALPITYAILIWGFQKDPFKLARQLPQEMAFLVPQSLRAGAKTGRRPQPAPAPQTEPSSLDDLATVASESMPDAAPAAAADGVPADSAEPAEPGDEKAMTADAAAKTAEDKPKEDPEMAAVPGLAALPPELAGEFRAVLAKLTTPEEFQAALARLTAPAEPAPMIEPEPEPPAPAPEPAPMPAPEPLEPAPLDLTGLEEAVAQAAEALESLEAVSDLDDPDRKRLMVGWYRRLVRVGEQLALLETSAADAGRPLDDAPESAAGLLDRIRASDVAVDDLRTLGRMWLAAQKRRADGTVLVATVQATRQVGPYWSTAVNVAGHGADRTIAVISRKPPAVDIGDSVMITGVLFDADTVWASDVRPAGAPLPADDDLPAIGIPPVFEVDGPARGEPAKELRIELPKLQDSPAGEPADSPKPSEASEKTDAGQRPAEGDTPAEDAGSGT